MQRKTTTRGAESAAAEPLKGRHEDVLNIADIAIREKWQVRNKIDEATVSKYRTIYKNGGDAAMPPILVALIGATYILVDGWHRLTALKSLDRTQANVTVFRASASDAEWEAAKANLANGKPLSKREHRNVFRAYISSRQHLRDDGSIRSYREMEDALGHVASYHTLSNWMHKDHPKIAAKMANRYERDNHRTRPDSDRPGLPRLDAGPLRSATDYLDTILAEARSMPPEDRRAVIDHAERWLADLRKLPRWSPREVADGAPFAPLNSDF